MQHFEGTIFKDVEICSCFVCFVPNSIGILAEYGYIFYEVPSIDNSIYLGNPEIDITNKYTGSKLYLW
jgi:hypothetical protein